MVEIAGKDGVRDWLESQDRQTQIWFAARGALRTLPGLGNWDASTRNNLAFVTARLLFLSTALAVVQDADAAKLRHRFRTNLRFNRLPTEPQSTFATEAWAAANASVSAWACASQEEPRPFEAADPVGSFLYTSLSLQPVSNMAATLDANEPNSWGPLWPNAVTPAPLSEGWTALKRQWEHDSADWSFWVEWYEAILNGAPLPWDLTHRIALEITDAEWDEGQTTVARRISEIRGAYDVQVLANEIAGSAYLAQPGRPGMGHNQPPSVIDDDLPAQAHETIIWAATDELRTQAQAETPAPSRVKRALSLIAGVLKASGLWVAGTVATGISVAAVTVVKKGADAWAVQNQDKLVELIDAALRWLSLLH